MVGTQVLMYQSCRSYDKKNKVTGQKTGEKGYILVMQEIKKGVDGETIINSVTFFPDKFDRPELQPFDLVECKMEFELNRTPALLELGKKVDTNNKITISLPVFEKA